MSHSSRIFTVFYISLLAINFNWFISGGALLETEAPVRIVMGSLFIFFLPGLVWGEILGYKSRHPLETIALSFALTITVEILLLPIPFIFGAKIDLWINLLFGVCLLGIVLFYFRTKRKKDIEFLNQLFIPMKRPAPLNVSAFSIMIIIIFLSYGTYRWGEALTDIAGEKLLQLVFVRYYYSLPMTLHDLGLHPGDYPSNLVHLWEYLIAGWAKVIQSDPLPIFPHSRFIIPLFGFSGMYLLIRNIFKNEIKAEAVFWGVMIMCLGGFVLLSPSNMDWIKSDPYRLATAFMGTSHHGDTAMEILLALSAGLFLMTFRCPTKKNFFLLAGILSASFLWHPREFFQTAVYAGVFGITLFITPHPDKKALIKRWILAMAAFLIVAAVIFPITKSVMSIKSRGYDEFAIKRMAVNYAVSSENIFGIRNFFNFPFHFILAAGDSVFHASTKKSVADAFTKNWHYSLWLLLSALAIPILAVWGDRDDKRLTFFYLLLWLLVLVWNFGMLFVIILTYSEFLMTTPRILYIFSYIIISACIFTVATRLAYTTPAKRYYIAYLVGMLAFGFFIRLWWHSGTPYIGTVTKMLSLSALMSLILLISKRKSPAVDYKSSLLVPSVFGMLLIFLPITWEDLNANIMKIIKDSRPSVGWFGNSNIFGFSDKLIRYLRMLPPKQTFLANPLGNGLVSVYSPQYMAVVPNIVYTVISAYGALEEVRSGRHPLFIISEKPNPDNFIGMKPNYECPSFNWKGPNIITSKELSKVTALSLQGIGGGDFIFERAYSNGETVIKVSPSRRAEHGGPLVIQFGYALGGGGLSVKINSGQKIAFMISARHSGKVGKARLFIRDKTENGERIDSPIDGAEWRQYAVAKTIGNGSKDILSGIKWEPESDNEWLEIRNPRIFIFDKMNIDHKKVTDNLLKNNVDYILIDREYYNLLLPYFKKFCKDYDIVFENPERGEMVVRYRKG